MSSINCPCNCCHDPHPKSRSLPYIKNILKIQNIGGIKDLIMIHNVTQVCDTVCLFQCLVRFVVPQMIHSDDKPVKETILEDSECPLQIFRDWTSDQGRTDTDISLYQCLYRVMLIIIGSNNQRVISHSRCINNYFTEALVFQLKKRPPDFMPKKGLKPSDRMGLVHGALPPEKLPYLVELSPGASLTHTQFLICFVDSFQNINQILIIKRLKI